MVVADYFKTVDFKEFSSDEGMVRGRLLFLGGHVLTFMEYIQTGKERPKYRFNLSDGKSNVIFRSVGGTYFLSLRYVWG